MNRGDERALRRAAAKLNISSNETLLEFDIGSFLFLILPEDFPHPLPYKAKRIDLVASDQALYIHSFGIHRRYGWKQILECSFGDEFFCWREVSGHKCQVHMIRGFRPLAQVVSECIEKYERNLDPKESQGRMLQRSSYDSQDRQREARGAILNRHNQYHRAMEFSATVTDVDGESLASSVVLLTRTGIEFSFDEIRRQLFFPYELIDKREVRLSANTLSVIIHDPDFRSFTVEGKTPMEMSQWKADLDQLIAVELT